MDINILEINSEILRNNIKAIKEHAKTKFCLPVKANAYGHGLELVVRNTNDIVDFYAVSCATEALEVCKHSFEVPVLVFGVVEATYVSELIKRDIRFSIHSIADIEKLEYYAQKNDKKLKAHIFVNTGMNMLGVDYVNAEQTIENVLFSKHIELEGVYSHLACADDKENTFNQLQIERFLKVANFAKAKKETVMCHLANSYTSIGQDDVSLDMIRPGILSYGFLPEFEVDENLKQIKPIAKLNTQVIRIITLRDMLEVGYSISYKGKADEQIAILPIGYGDGFPRLLGNKGYVYINDISYQIIGRVNMDTMAISLGGNNHGIEIGAIVEVISDNPRKQNSVKNTAKILGTIEYDIITSLSKRVVRKIV
ncbi:MAG: alanine racemase [Francisella sp.]|jgi:alanine racemase